MSKAPEKAIDNPKWAALLKKRTISHLKEHPEKKPLKKKLLGHGGNFVVIWVPEPDLNKILERGQLFSNYKILLNRMRRSSCHSNVAELWSTTKRTKIATGWALSSDGLWRQHSWLLKGKTIIETTEPREKYFGIILGQEEAGDFFDANW